MRLPSASSTAGSGLTPAAIAHRPWPPIERRHQCGGLGHGGVGAHHQHLAGHHILDLHGPPSGGAWPAVLSLSLCCGVDGGAISCSQHRLCARLGGCGMVVHMRLFGVLLLLLVAAKVMTMRQCGVLVLMGMPVG